MTQRRELEKEKLKTKILDTACKLLRKGSYEQLSIRKIAKKIDYSPTMLYTYFKSKADIMYHIVERLFGRMMDRFKTLDLTDVDKSMRQGLRIYIETALEYPDEYRLVFSSSESISKEDPCDYLNQDSLNFAAFQVLQSAIQSGMDADIYVKADAMLAAQSAWASLHGLCILLIQNPLFPWKDREELIARHIDILVAGLKGGQK